MTRWSCDWQSRWLVVGLVPVLHQLGNRALQFGQKKVSILFDSILATESIFFSIRYSNLINLPLVHWYSNSKLEVILTARCYASAVLAMGLCLSVRVRLSQVGVLLKRQNVGSHKQYHTISRRLYSFLMPKISAKFDRGHPLRGRRMQVGWSKSATFDK